MTNFEQIAKLCTENATCGLAIMPLLTGDAAERLTWVRTAIRLVSSVVSANGMVSTPHKGNSMGADMGGGYELTISLLHGVVEVVVSHEEYDTHNRLRLGLCSPLTAVVTALAHMPE